jgi:putative FmdB family regulatory protein
MPIYEYICRACDAHFEALVRGETQPPCPSCGSIGAERLFSLPAVKSESTRAKAMRAAKKRDSAQAQDRMHERIRYEESHDRHG